MMIAVGQPVRLLLNNEKSSGWNFSRDAFAIAQVLHSKYGPDYRKTTYRVRNKDGQELENVFYNNQLLPYYTPDAPRLQAAEQYIVDKIQGYCVIEAGRGNEQGVIVRWMNFSPAESAERVSHMDDEIPKIMKKARETYKPVWSGAYRTPNYKGTFVKNGKRVGMKVMRLKGI